MRIKLALTAMVSLIIFPSACADDLIEPEIVRLESVLVRGELKKNCTCR